MANEIYRYSQNDKKLLIAVKYNCFIFKCKKWLKHYCFCIDNKFKSKIYQYWRRIIEANVFLIIYNHDEDAILNRQEVNSLLKLKILKTK